MDTPRLPLPPVDGLTLRDYFAAAALASCYAQCLNTGPAALKLLGPACYSAADAMLAARTETARVEPRTSTTAETTP